MSTANGQTIFKGALGFDDWIWWAGIGSLSLFVLLLLVCCCVCMQRAKRKGHEEALAAVETRQRITQQRERAEQQQQQQRYQQAQQTRGIASVNNNGYANDYQPPATSYSKQVTAVQLAPPPNRKNYGPQVAANGYRGIPPQLHTQQYSKEYSSLPYQQESQAAGQPPGQGQRYQIPPGQGQQYQIPPGQGQRYQTPPQWNNANYAQNRDYGANIPPSSFHYNDHKSSGYPNNTRFDDPYPKDTDPDGVPFMPVTSPSSSIMKRQYGAQAQSRTPSKSEQEQALAPFGVPAYSRASPSPSKTRASAGLGPGNTFQNTKTGGTLQSRIDALRSADTDEMMHSRVSVEPSEMSYLSTRTGGDTPRALKTKESYDSESRRRFGLLANSLLSPNPSAASNSPFSSSSDSFPSDHAFKMLDSGTFKSTERTDALRTKPSNPVRGSTDSHDSVEF